MFQARGRGREQRHRLAGSAQSTLPGFRERDSTQRDPNRPSRAQPASELNFLVGKLPRLRQPALADQPDRRGRAPWNEGRGDLDPTSGVSRENPTCVQAIPGGIFGPALGESQARTSTQEDRAIPKRWRLGWRDCVEPSFGFRRVAASTLARSAGVSLKGFCPG